MNFPYLLSLLTASGVVLHEFAHKTACELLDVDVIEVSYLQRPDSSGHIGYVRHVVPRSYTKRVLIAVAPLALNVSVAASLVVAASAYLEFGGYMAAAYYLGFSALYHAFPSEGDAGTLAPHSRRGYLHPAFLLFLPFTLFLLVFTRYVDSWWFSGVFAVSGVAASALYAEKVVGYAGI